MSTIDLLRHGEPDGGVRYRGDGVDDPLSERGWEQMWAAAGEFSDWTHVISSPLQRCCRFAEAIAERHRLPLAVDRRFLVPGMWNHVTRYQSEERESACISACIASRYPYSEMLVKWRYWVPSTGCHILDGTLYPHRLCKQYKLVEAQRYGAVASFYVFLFEFSAFVEYLQFLLATKRDSSQFQFHFKTLLIDFFEQTAAEHVVHLKSRSH